MSDLINRQDVIDEIKEIYEWHDNVTKERIIEHVKRLPSVEPESIRCKDCKHKPHTSDEYDYDNGYCCNCISCLLYLGSYEGETMSIG